MADRKNKRGYSDRRRISLTEDYEVRYWTAHFGCNAEDLREAIEKVGHMVSAVEGYFG
jgi:hypothetical protein